MKRKKMRLKIWNKKIIKIIKKYNQKKIIKLQLNKMKLMKKQKSKKKIKKMQILMKLKL